MGGVFGIREKGTYHAIPQYYSPYHVRPLLPPDIVGACVRSTLAKLGIPIHHEHEKAESAPPREVLPKPVGDEGR